MTPTSTSYSVVLHGDGSTTLMVVAGYGQIRDVEEAVVFTAHGGVSLDPLSVVHHRAPTAGEQATDDVCHIIGEPCVETPVGSPADAFTALGQSLDEVYAYLGGLL